MEVISLIEKEIEEQALQEELLLEWSKLTTLEKRKWIAGLKASNNISNKGEAENAERN